MGIFNNLLRRKTEEVPPEQPKIARRPDPPTPLMLLLPDAGGIASYALNVFPSAKAAEFYLDSLLRGQVPDGAVLFWALSWQPAPHPDYTQAEPLVVIRDTRKATVYPFSFADLDSAHDFIRHEMNRGLDLGQVMVFFAVPARIEVDFWGRSTIIPPAAPVRSFQPTRVEAVPQAMGARAPKPATRIATPEPKPARNGHPALPDDDGRYLNETDISEVVQMMRDLTNDTTGADSRVVPMPRRSNANGNGNASHGPTAAPSPSSAPIEFTPAAQKVQEARAGQAMITAWANFSQAIDEALDVYVAHQVSAKLIWNRICRAIREALAARQRVRMLAVWQASTNAIVNAVDAMREHEAGQAEKAARAEAKARAQAAKAEAAVARAAEEAAAQAAAERTANAGKSMRRTWLNISWTLEEAVYAHALEQKARAIRDWRFASAALIEALDAKKKHDAATQFAWSNASLALHKCAEVFLVRQRMFRSTWRTLSFELGGAAYEKRRMDGVFAAMHNAGLAIDEAIDAKVYRDGMVAVWNVLISEITFAASAQLYHEEILRSWASAGAAFGELCRAYVKKQKRAIRAWGRLAVAFGGVVDARVRLDGYIAAWQNAGAAAHEAVIAHFRHEALVEAWANAGAFFIEAVQACVRYQSAVRTWNTLSEAILDGVTEKFRRDSLIAAWTNAAAAIDVAVRTAIAKQIALETAWSHLVEAFVTAAEAQRFHEMSVAAWSNAVVAMAETGNAYLFQLKSRSAWRNASRALVEAIPLHNFKMAAMEGWNNCGIAIKEAVVAEAKMRIAQAGLDKALMTEVDRAVREAQKAVKRAIKEGKEVKPFVAADVTVAPAPEFVEFSSKVTEVPVGIAEAIEVEEPVAVFGADLSEEAAEPVAEAEIAGDEIDFKPLEDEEQQVEPKAGLFGIWKPAGRRWEPREEPFGGFNSPPGRFHRRENKDDDTAV